MSLDYEGEFYRGGLLKTIKIKEHKYDLVEFTITSKLTDEVTGKVITDNGHTSFYSTKEFKEFFLPMINEMKARLENDNTTSKSE
jgi:lantibiotic modifying enzyme